MMERPRQLVTGAVKPVPGRLSGSGSGTDSASTRADSGGWSNAVIVLDAVIWRPVTGPEEMGDGLRGVDGDPGFEVFQIVGDGFRFFAGLNRANSIELEFEPAAGEMGAEDVEDRGARQGGQVGPDGEEAVGTAQ